MRLIDANALRDEWLYKAGKFEPNDVLDSIDDAPTIEPEKHGLWIEHKGGDDYIGYPIYECSECGYDAGETATNYCPQLRSENGCSRQRCRGDGRRRRMNEYIVRETGYPGAIKQEIVQELVRCRDCKWYEISRLKADGTDDRRFKPDLCVLHSRNFPGDYFCADGEARGEEG